MTFITGWINSSLNQEEGNILLNKIKGNIPSHVEKTLYVQTNDFVTCLASKHNLTEKRNYLISVIGSNLHDNSSLNDQDEYKLSLIKGYEEKGEQFLANINGGFSLVLVDQERQKINLATQPNWPKEP